MSTYLASAGLAVAQAKSQGVLLLQEGRVAAIAGDTERLARAIGVLTQELRPVKEEVGKMSAS
eukprot:6980089-Lingulodinium_polyedra.AAC.1